MRKAFLIVGSTSCAGAGIQADNKTITMNGVYAMQSLPTRSLSHQKEI